LRETLGAVDLAAAISATRVDDALARWRMNRRGFLRADGLRPRALIASPFLERAMDHFVA
jgi:hypothetical protein